MAGTFGYELNLAELSPEDKLEIRRQIEEYHKYAPLIQNGLYYRLSNPYEEPVGAWAFVAEDGSEVLVQGIMLEIHGNMTANYVKLQGLKRESAYKDEISGRVYEGSALMEAGIPIPPAEGEFQAFQMLLKEYFCG